MSANTKGVTLSEKEDIVVEVIARLNQSPYRGLRGLSCDLTEDGVILHGRVSTFHEKQLAQEAIRDIKGVDKIVNEVTVDS